MRRIEDIIAHGHMVDAGVEPRLSQPKLERCSLLPGPRRSCPTFRCYHSPDSSGAQHQRPLDTWNLAPCVHWTGSKGSFHPDEENAIKQPPLLAWGVLFRDRISACPSPPPRFHTSIPNLWCPLPVSIAERSPEPPFTMLFRLADWSPRFSITVPWIPRPGRCWLTAGVAGRCLPCSPTTEEEEGVLWRMMIGRLLFLLSLSIFSSFGVTRVSIKAGLLD